MANSIKLQTDCILHAPFQKYSKDFTFIVNSEPFETSLFVADLISPKISSQRLIDPTLSEFTINTNARGDFNKIINLINFQSHEISDEDIQFIIEVFDQLGTEKIDINIKPEEEINNDNIIEHIRKHQEHPNFYKTQLDKEIKYFTSHFYELKDKLIQNIKCQKMDLNDNIIESIISSNKLVLDSEKDLLEFVNELYLRDRKFARFYEFVDFRNVEQEEIVKFIDLFDMSDMTTASWSSICDRLELKVLKDDKNLVEEKPPKHEYKGVKCFIEIADKSNEFDGIMNYLQTHSSIKDEIGITFSTNCNNQDPFNLLKYQDKKCYFETSDDDPDSWICFEFKKHQIIPSSYIIRSYCSDGNWHLKSWDIEGSNDKNKWIPLDNQRNNSVLNGANNVHMFPVSGKNNKQSFKYLRIHLTGPNWCNNNGIMMNSIEFYGKLI